MVLPSLFVVGAAKTATTSLATYFDQHPDVCFCRPHEPNYFSFDCEYQLGLDYYKNLYGHYRGEPVVGEKSWSYSCAGVYPAALQRILEVVPSFKAIYVVRDPVKRAVSLWFTMRIGEPIDEHIVDADLNVAIARDPLIIDSSLYNTQIARFEEALGRENVLIVFYEDFVSRPDEYYRAICEFLQISVFQPETVIKRNVSADKGIDRFALEWLRRVGLDKPLRALVPASVRTLAQTTLKKPISKVILSDEAKTAFLEKTADDCKALLQRVGKSETFWTFDT